MAWGRSRGVGVRQLRIQERSRDVLAGGLQRERLRESGHLSTLHLKLRRSSRPIKPKPKKGERLRAQGEAAAVAVAAQRETASVKRIRLLSKLAERQRAAGETESAKATEEHVAAARAALMQLERP